MADNYIENQYEQYQARKAAWEREKKFGKKKKAKAMAKTEAIAPMSTILPATSDDYDELICLWDASVRSTHHFLTEKDIQFYKPLIRNEYFPAVELYFIKNDNGKPAAFLGLSEDNIEMLFVHPLSQGKGYGKKLIEFAIHKKDIYKVDVNEQNDKALHFYLNRGFKVTGRDATDAQGNPYPILHMQYHIRRVKQNKKEYLDLLLLADEEEQMIDRYLERGEMFALYDDDLKSICVITEEDNGVSEIKNIATYPQYRHQGYGKRLIEFLFKHYESRCTTMLVGTGDSPLTIPFYEHCGFTYSHRIKDFFTENYSKPIIEGGVLLKDMVYLKKEI